MERGYVEIYTGDGKGKTTATIGLAVRAVGAGKRVLFLQFMKSKSYSEHAILSALSDRLTLIATGKPFFVMKEGMKPEQHAAWHDEVVFFPEGSPPPEYLALMKDTMRLAEQAVSGGAYDVVVLDELLVALYFGLVEASDVEHLLARRLPVVELVLTGRGAPDWLLQRADLVTEMKEIKHYYRQGVEARKGIEN